MLADQHHPPKASPTPGSLSANGPRDVRAEVAGRAAIQPPKVIDLGVIDYPAAYDIQVMHLEEVQASRDAGSPEIGRILLVEHPPVITIGRHPGSAKHLTASAALLAQRGVAVVDSDRGGDITYHGPGQLVVYPIIDLNRVNLGLHAHMRLMEAAVIEACSLWGVGGEREPGATGVWVQSFDEERPAKIAAMGVRVRRWITMHGLALNIDPDLSHFDLIIPCGLTGRRVTSLRQLLGASTPSMQEAKQVLTRCLTAGLIEAARAADASRACSR